MRTLYILISLALFTGCFDAAAHPLHLSITNITYDNGKLKISMKTFLDDWEVAYFHFHSKEVDFTKPEKREIPWFGQYLTDRFKFAHNEEDTPFSLSIDSVMIEDDAMTIEMHCLVPGKPNSLYIYNALLTDIFPDQTNLVIFGFKKRETGIKFDVRKLDAEVLLN